jgi:hypothetical protein
LKHLLEHLFVEREVSHHLFEAAILGLKLPRPP